MWKLLLVIGVVGLGTWIIRQQLPDIQRYLKINSM
jgi:hypothetical protein